MCECWKDIDGFEGKYQVNQNGEILNTVTGKISKGSVDKLTGYVRVNLYNGNNNMFLVHRLVAESFIPNPNGLQQIHHIDGDKTNNHVSNLEWVSIKEHSEKMSIEQKTKFRENYQNNLKKRKFLQQVIVCHTKV